jgi:hypothetical protein
MSKYKVLLDASGLKFERVLPTHSPYLGIIPEMRKKFGEGFAVFQRNSNKWV